MTTTGAPAGKRRTGGPGSVPRVGSGYVPALDGVRAFAVMAVMLYHAGVVRTPGGFLGVDLFFVLSGYLITTLLLVDHATERGINLTQFWLRRARRLLPAVFAVIAFVAVYATLWADPAQQETIRGDAVATLLYVANWRFVLDDASYFNQFLTPSPLRHMWSLGIEEQWYLLWPPLLWLGLKVRGHASIIWPIALSVAALASMGLMAVLYDPGTDPSRVYYGTDTRVFALLIGAIAAFAWPRLGPAFQGRAVAITSMGATGLLVWTVMVATTSDTSRWLYPGGFALAAVASLALVMCAITPDNPIAGLLATRPLPYLGRLSYGLYLWHWPVYVWLTPERTGLTGIPLLSTRLTVTTVVAVLSYHLIEQPIRGGALRRRPIAVTAAAAIVSVLVGVLMVGRAPVAEDPFAAALAADGAPPAALPPVPDASQTRVLVVGDSVAWGLAENAAAVTAPMDLAVANGAMIGCGVFDGQYEAEGRQGEPRDYDCDRRLDRWRTAVERFQPHISVIVIGSYEVFDWSIGETYHEFGTAGFAEFAREQLRLDTDVLNASGGHTVLLTAQCMQPPAPAVGQPSGQERREPERVAWLNEQIREFATDNPADVTLIDLAGYLCPTGEYVGTMDDVPLHRDGMHFTPDGAEVVWSWLGPKLRPE